MTGQDALAAALHAAIDDIDPVGWDDARTTDLRPEDVHAAIDATLAFPEPVPLDVDTLAHALCHRDHITGYRWCRRHRDEAEAIAAEYVKGRAG